jgi:hypothetical protein
MTMERPDLTKMSFVDLIVTMANLRIDEPRVSSLPNVNDMRYREYRAEVGRRIESSQVSYSIR